MSDDDWDIDEPKKSGASTPAAAIAPPVVRAPARNKWADEDAEEDDEDDWDVSDSEKKAKPASGTPTTTAAPVRKKKLKEKLAEKERLANAPPAEDDLIDTRTEQDRRREARERELAADLAVASELLGGIEVADPKATLESVLSSNPKTKEDFAELSKNVMVLLARHTSNPLYPSFVEIFNKDLCESLSAVQVRKVGSALGTLGNQKQQEERDKASGKKKTASKPKLGAIKSLNTVDTQSYDDVLDDDDFM